MTVDAFSKSPEVYKLNRHSTTTQALDALRSFSYHGLPHRLVTDNEPQFTASEFQEFMQRNRCKHQRTSSYRPPSNGQAERLVQELKKSLKNRPDGRSVNNQAGAYRNRGQRGQDPRFHGRAKL